MKTLNEMINETTKEARENNQVKYSRLIDRRVCRQVASVVNEYDTDFGVVKISVAPRQGSRNLSTYFKLNNKRIKLVDLENMFMATA